MTINRWMVKLWYIHTMEHHSAIKKEWTTDTQNDLNESVQNDAERKKKSISKDDMANNSVYIRFLKWLDYRNGEHSHGCQGLRTEWGQQVSGRGWEGNFERPCGDGRASCLNHVLAVVLDHRFARRRKTGQSVYWDLSVLLLTTACEFTIISK